MKKLMILALATVAFCNFSNVGAMVVKVQDAIKSGKYKKSFDDLAVAQDDKARQALINKRGLPFTLADYKAWKEAQKVALSPAPTSVPKHVVAPVPPVPMAGPLQVMPTGPTIDELYTKAEQAKTEQEIHLLKADAAAKGASPDQLRKFEDLVLELKKKQVPVAEKRTKALPVPPSKQGGKEVTEAPIEELEELKVEEITPAPQPKKITKALPEKPGGLPKAGEKKQLPQKQELADEFASLEQRAQAVLLLAADAIKTKDASKIAAVSKELKAVRTDLSKFYDQFQNRLQEIADVQERAQLGAHMNALIDEIGKAQLSLLPKTSAKRAQPTAQAKPVAQELNDQFILLEQEARKVLMQAKNAEETKAPSDISSVREQLKSVYEKVKQLYDTFKTRENEIADAQQRLQLRKQILELREQLLEAQTALLRAVPEKIPTKLKVTKPSLGMGAGITSLKD